MKTLNKIKLILLTLCLTFCFSFTCNAAEASQPDTPIVPSRFTQDGDNYIYFQSGEKVRNSFVTIKKKTYYFDKKGVLVLSSMFTKGKYTYYADSNGVIAKNCFVNIKTKRYFFDEKGRRKTGWIDYNGHTYYCRPSGKAYRNEWAKIGKYYYYFGPSYFIRKNRWIDKKYYVDGNGRRVIEPVVRDGDKDRVIPMKNIKQNPQLPTGCESVALTIVLNHYGFGLDKTTIASKYLPKSSSNFVTAFCGNPFSSSGGGIYSPGLTLTANKFLRAQKSKLRATDLTGTNFSALYRYVKSGIPVIVWNTMYMRYPYKAQSMQYKGKTWTFYYQEHCVVLCGYSANKKKVLINDPLSGLVWRDSKTFINYYNKLGKMAIVIQ